MKILGAALVLAAVILLVSPLISAQEIWHFDNFVNRYRVYGNANCNIEGTKPCPNELSWEGNSIKFRFNLNSIEGLSDNLIFKFNVIYYARSSRGKDANLEIKAGKYKTSLTGNSTGLYSVSIPKIYFKAGRNAITIKGRNINEGYGNHPPTVVLGWISLENS